MLPLAALTLVASCAADDSGTSPAQGTGTNPTEGTGTPIPYTLGTTATSSSVTFKTVKAPNGAYGQVYTLTATGQSNFLIAVSTSAFKPYLGLFTASGVVVAENNTDTRIRAFLPAGNYLLVVSEVDGRDGSFSLTSSPSSLGGCIGPPISPADLGNTVRGATLSGTITSTDCGNAQAKSHIYDLPLAAGEAITATFTADKASGVAIRSNGTVLSSMELAAAGTITISMTATVTGRYQLSAASRTSSSGVSSLPVTYTIATR